MGIDFRGKTILAPMVRVNTLPMRLLALEYGADLVYTEEIIDYRLIKCKRIENVALGTIDFVDEAHEVLLRVSPVEKSRLITQIGTCDPDRALMAARIVEADVSAIDVNMGCPKSFSLKGGMGAALLSKPQLIQSILTKLVTNLSIPVTCKIRVLPSMPETIKLVKLIAETGVSAIAVHGRTISERPANHNRDDFILSISKEISIPLIANGGSADIRRYSDIEKFRTKTGASSVMIARTAGKNCSIFKNSPELDELDEVVKKYLRLAIEFDNKPQASKYVIRQMLEGKIEEERYQGVNTALNHAQLFEVWDMGDEYTELDQRVREKIQKVRDTCSASQTGKRKLEEDSPTIEDSILARLEKENVKTMSIMFLKKLWYDDGSRSPKTILHEWLQGRGITTLPTYETISVDKNFLTIVHVEDSKYASLHLEKSKRAAEQASALVACLRLDLIDEETIHPAFTVGTIRERTLSNIKMIKSQM